MMFIRRLSFIGKVCFVAFIAASLTIAQSAPVLHLSRSDTNYNSDDAWWKHAVIYEIYPRSFQDTNGDGIGDLNGITRRLDYLKDLGIDAIWLTPIYPSPEVDFGYDISDYKTIDPQYGTLSDFDRLTAEAAKRHIRVLMDMVMNHTSDHHPWFVTSRSSRTNPYRDWYIWRDPKGYGLNGMPLPPNNWLSEFGHSAWQWDEKTKQFYYHKFYAQQPDLNWNNPKVHEAFKEILRFWLQRGVGGFRFDAITTLYEDPTLADEPYVRDKNGDIAINPYGDKKTDGSKTENLPSLHAVMQEMRYVSDKFDSNTFPGSRVLIGETYVPTIRDLVRMYGTAARPEFHLPMDTQVGMINKLDVAVFRTKLGEAENGLDGNAPLLLFDNHDNPRMDLRYGDGVHDTEIERALATVLLASSGSALVYYGDEIGMKTTLPTRKEEVKDPIGIVGWPKEKGRDGERTPMQWNLSQNAGFSMSSPWLPVPKSAKTVNVQSELNDANSMLNWYKSLIWLRKNNSVFQLGNNLMLDTTNAEVLSWMRKTTGSAPVIITVNFTAKSQIVDLSAVGDKTTSLQTLLKSPGGLDPKSLAKIELKPFGVYIGELK
jgi:alpha-glucosidase